MIGLRSRRGTERGVSLTNRNCVRWAVDILRFDDVAQGYRRFVLSLDALFWPKMTPGEPTIHRLHSNWRECMSFACLDCIVSAHIIIQHTGPFEGVDLD